MKQLTLKDRAINELIENPEEIDTLFWMWRRGEITTEQYLARVDELEERTIVELTQRKDYSDERDNDQGDMLRGARKESA